MKNYNGSENSGISGYEFTKNGINIKYKDGRVYLYNDIKPGKDHVEKMKTLAPAGSGLAT